MKIMRIQLYVGNVRQSDHSFKIADGDGFWAVRTDLENGRLDIMATVNVTEVEE